MKNFHVEVIELDSSGGKLYPVLLWNQEEVILIDTGLPETLQQLIKKIEELGFPISSITKIILTHQDMDHIGNANYFEPFGTKIYASKIDTPYINGSKELLKYNVLKNKSNRTDIEEEIYQVIKKNLAKSHVGIDFEFSEKNDEIIFKKLQVINTPGHTPGHISIYLPAEKILIVGDAVSINETGIQPPDINFCSDFNAAMESYKKIMNIDFNQIISYHDGKFMF